MPPSRTTVTYEDRVCMALADMARAGLMKFSEAVVVDRLKRQNLPPLGRHAARRVNVILLGEIKKGHIGYLSRSKGTYMMTTAGAHSYAESCATMTSSSGRSSSNVSLVEPSQVGPARAPAFSQQAQGAQSSHGQALDALHDAVFAFSPLVERLKAVGLVDAAETLKEVTSLELTNEPDSEMTEKFLATFADRVQSMVPAFQQVIKQLDILQDLTRCIDTQITMGFGRSASVRLEALSPDSHPVLRKFIEFARTALTQHDEVEKLNDTLADWAPERMELMGEIQELHQQIANLTAKP